jgi:hypothetical protein
MNPLPRTLRDASICSRIAELVTPVVDLHRRCRRTPSRFRRLLYELFEDRRLLALGDLLHTLVDPGTLPQAGSLFGNAVATDGNLTVVGASNTDADGFSNSGRAYVFNSATGHSY